MQTLKVEQTLLQAGLLHSHLEMGHLLNTVRQAKLSLSFLQSVGYNVDRFLHIWLVVAVVVKLLQLSPC